MNALLALVRGRAPIRPLDAARAAAGALVGLAVISLALRWAFGPTGLATLLVPAIGASAVLVFSVPASPLAQPRSVIGGNGLSALIGVTCALLIPDPVAAGAVAVAAAILSMSLLGCLHPPGGGIALGSAVAVSSHVAGYLTVWPVVLCSVALVLAAVVILNLTGRSYPHRAAAPVNVHHTQDPEPAARVGYTPADLDRALAHYGELLDVSREDLDALFREVEREAHRRIHSQIRCEDIMSRDVLTVDAHQTADSALVYLRRHDLWIAPVVDAERRVVGMVRRGQLLTARDRLVEAVLDPFVPKVRPSTAIEQLLPLLSTGQSHEVMVVDDARRLVGVITQTDLLAVLYRAHIVEAAASGQVSAAPPATA